MSPCLTLALLLAVMPGDTDEKILADAGSSADGPSLVAFLKGRIPTAQQRERLPAMVRQLGDESFDNREQASKALRDAGPVALPLLQAALSSSDVEVVRRATACCEEIDKKPHQRQLAAALRLLSLHKPAGADQALLEYVAWAEADEPSEDVLAALLAVGLKDAAPTPAVRTALADRSPASRAAAAYVIGKAGREHRKLLVSLLADSSSLVRYHAAAALFIAGDKQAAPVLVDLLADDSYLLALRAEGLLLVAAGDSAPAVILGGDAKARQITRKAWSKWWDEKGDKLDLTQVRFENALMGWTVICEDEIHGAGPGHVRAFGRDGKERWHFGGIDSPTDVQLLPTGRVLVAEHWPKKVTEHDRTGKVIWEKTLAESPVSCQRLANGNTFIATYVAILELTPAGKEIYSIPNKGGMIYCAEKLRDGTIVCIDSSGNVTEYDRDRKVVRSFKPSSYSEGAVTWASVQKLGEGKYLLALSGSDRVVETDETGKILWEATVNSPTWATRLPNGRTLVTSINDHVVVELDASGKVVWKLTCQHRLFRARPY